MVTGHKYDIRSIHITVIVCAATTLVILFVMDDQQRRQRAYIMQCPTAQISDHQTPEQRLWTSRPQTQLSFLNTSPEAVSELQSSSPTSDVYQKRIALLEERCRNHSQYMSSGTRLTMKADEGKYNYFFCFIPKVASTSWLKTLARAGGKENPETEFIHSEKLNDYVRPFSSFPLRRKQEILRNHFKFMFVRHPFERLVSAFRDKILWPGKHKSYNYYRRIAETIKRRYRAEQVRDNGTVTFEEFVRYLLEPVGKEHPMSDRHWNTFDSLCQPCRIQYNFVGHFETLSEDVAYVLRRLSMSGNYEFERPRWQRNRNATAFMFSFISTLAPDLLSRLRDRFSADFDMFGYTWPP